MENLKQLQILSKVINSDKILTEDDVQKVLKSIVEIFSNFKKSTDELNAETRQVVQEFFDIISKEHDKVLKSVENTSQKSISEATEQVNKALEEMKRISQEILDSQKEEETETEDEEDDLDEEAIVTKVLEQIKLPENKEFVLTGENIVDSINELSLDDENKIDASHIKNLPTPIIQGSNISKSIYQLEDVRLSSLANDDVLKYNSTTKQWENGTGGGGATAFTDLTDVPSSYSGQGGKAVRVNVGETGLEFFTAGTVTSVAATVPTGLTISGSPITAAGTLAIGLDTGYVIPLQSTIDAKVPYTGATANVDLGVYDLITDTITAKSSAGLLLENASGGDVLHIGSGGGVNATAYGGWNFDGATANTIASFGASKTLTSLDTATYPSLTELSYVKGVTSAIQTQINGKQATISFGTGVETALGVNVGSAGAFVTNGGALGTPSSGTVTNLTGTASININGTVGATTPTTGAFTTISASSALTASTTIELGHASDTTLSRVSAGVAAIEGNNIITANNNATASDINTGTSTTKFNTPDGLAGSYAGTKSVAIAVFAPTTDVATGDGKAYITIPEALNGMDLIRAQGTVVTAGTTNATTVMIHNVTDAVDMLSGAISIASGGTVGTVGTINTSNDSVATNDVLRIDVDSVSTTAPKGLMVVLEFRLP